MFCLICYFMVKIQYLLPLLCHKSFISVTTLKFHYWRFYFCKILQVFKVNDNQIKCAGNYPHWGHLAFEFQNQRLKISTTRLGRLGQTEIGQLKFSPHELGGDIDYFALSKHYFKIFLDTLSSAALNCVKHSIWLGQWSLSFQASVKMENTTCQHIAKQDPFEESPYPK